MKYKSIKSRILAWIKKVDGCWEWQGHLSQDGYGRIQMGSRKDNTRKVKEAHIISYESFVGKVPEGLVLDHLCRNRRCVNPTHLEPVTMYENIKRGEAGKHFKDKTHCPAGHPYQGTNVMLTTKGYRRCRKCTYTQTMKYYYQKKALLT
jgi:hypothetical protein